MDFKKEAKRLRKLADSLENMQEKPTEKLPERWMDLSQKERDKGLSKSIDCNGEALEAFSALSSLYDLRKKYWEIAGDWEPDWKDPFSHKYVIRFYQGKKETAQMLHTRYFLAFPTLDQAVHFLKHHALKIDQAEELL